MKKLFAILVVMMFAATASFAQQAATKASSQATVKANEKSAIKTGTKGVKAGEAKAKNVMKAEEIKVKAEEPQKDMTKDEKKM